MIGALLGTGTAMAIAVSDFAGGAATRRDIAIKVTAVTQLSSVVFVGILVILIPPTSVPTADVVAGTLGGIFLVGGLQCTYKSLARGAMGVISAIVGITSAIVPFIWALGRGETLVPAQWAGVLVALVAVIIAGSSGSIDKDLAAHRQDVLLATIGGLLFGLTFVALGRSSSGSQLISVLAMRSTTAVIAVGVCLKIRELFPSTVGGALAAIASGVTGTTAMALFVWAAHEGVASTVAILQATAPVGVALLAYAFFHQRLTRAHQLGIGLAVLSAALFAI